MARSTRSGPRACRGAGDLHSESRASAVAKTSAFAGPEAPARFIPIAFSFWTLDRNVAASASEWTIHPLAGARSYLRVSGYDSN